MPLCTTCTRAGSTKGYEASTSLRMPLLTAMTALASAYEDRSTQDETWYPPPSCSSFHGRMGSRECAVMTWGIP